MNLSAPPLTASEFSKQNQRYIIPATCALVGCAILAILILGTSLVLENTHILHLDPVTATKLYDGGIGLGISTLAISGIGLIAIIRVHVYRNPQKFLSTITVTPPTIEILGEVLSEDLPQVQKLTTSQQSLLVPVLDYWKSIALQQSDPQTSNIKQRLLMSDSIFLCESISTCITRAEEYNIFLIYKDLDENIRGIAVLNVRVNDIFIKYLAIDPSYLLKGVGSILIKATEKIAVTNGKQSIYLTPTKSALSFYINRGFTRDSDQPNTIKKVVRAAEFLSAA